MAAITTFPSRLGDINVGAASATDEANFALFLKKFSGEVLTSFHENQVFRGLHRVRTIPNGKSAQFPVIGTASANFHVPGESIIQSDDGAGGPKYLSEVKHAERIILVDHARQSSVLVSDIDEMMNHYETRATYAMELGEALANKADTTWAIVATRAARAAATLTGGNGGAVLTHDLVTATGQTRADNYMTAFYEAAKTLDNKKIPKRDRVIVIDPDTFYLLLQYRKDDLIDTDLSPGNGHVANATLKKAVGMDIVVSTNLPTTNIVTNEVGARNTYTGDFTKTKALVLQKQAFGTVQLRGLTVESGWEREYQAHLTIAKGVWGSDILRPECAIEIEDDGV